MAQAAFNHLKKIFPKVDSAYEAVSWGTGIGEGKSVNPKIVDPMKSIGVDVTDGSYFPKNVDHPSLQGKLARVVGAYTMGCMANGCELPSGMQITTKEIQDWALADPANEGTDVVDVRNKIIGNVLELLARLDGE